ncbi:MAG TPA: Eco29kI family restriction endonuclease [Sphingopyxis sp.]|uniref:Eco29kI family restriction endonuclease n=1 Tax=Sphingopyxis sp. TaxID=1908224 RepID=UPI002B8B3369|nr:Eco29kI family restriction endonuclease [Sphingopyxis sp.]HWW55403.1 Eco29kI family restriction endonuclease [Sphingopyxis sp.]
MTLAIELMEQPLHSVPPQTKFGGAGVYALYYGGDLDAYAPLVALDKAEGGWRIPIYVGRALRENARKGFTTRPVTEDALHERIRKHARSIAQTENLTLSDFRCRYLVLNDAYISLAESVMIATFRPLWNGMGLGSNQTGGPRMAGQASQWDSLHPGRKGRPAGTPESRALAAQAVKNVIASLGDPRDDPRTEAMIEKIRRRAPGDPPSTG